MMKNKRKTSNLVLNFPPARSMKSRIGSDNAEPLKFPNDILKFRSEMSGLNPSNFMVLEPEFSDADIYSEAVNNGKIVDIKINPSNCKVVNVVEGQSVSLKHLVDCITLPFTKAITTELRVTIPNHINQTTLTSYLSRAKTRLNVKVSFRFVGDRLTAHRHSVSFDLKSLEQLSEGQTVSLKCDDFSAIAHMRYLVRKKQYELGVRLKTKMEGNTLQVTWPTELCDQVSRPNYLSKRQLFDAWIDSQPWDVWVVLPEQWQQELAYHKQLASTHYSRSVKTKGISFVKSSICLSKHDGVVVVRSLGNVIHRTQSRSLNKLTVEDITAINNTLVTLGKTFEEIR